MGGTLPGVASGIDEVSRDPTSAPGRPPEGDAEAVSAVNRAFYEAFEQRDFGAMADLWEHSERVVCTHPGWGSLQGWPAVGASFFALFQGKGTMQFILTRERVEVAGDVAWVSVDENLLGDQAGATVAALNLFARRDGAWRVVGHHGSAVLGPPPGS